MFEVSVFLFFMNLCVKFYYCILLREYKKINCVWKFHFLPQIEYFKIKLWFKNIHCFTSMFQLTPFISYFVFYNDFLNNGISCYLILSDHGLWLMDKWNIMWALWSSDDPPENCHLNVKNARNLTFFQKNCQKLSFFTKKNCQ